MAQKKPPQAKARDSRGLWINVPAAERFWRYVEKGTDPADCWVWRGLVGRWGYGRFYPSSDHGVMAHRFSYESVNGPIPDGLTLDHLCRITSCVNPAHLEPVTVAENLARGDAPPARNARKTRCLRGHEFTSENTYRSGRGRHRSCRTCKLTVHQAKKNRLAAALRAMAKEEK